ncbi:MAG: hypothetical protein IPH15_00285 [Comamonadaceae bacterium]|nr:hypothetical protein [Comamonadaceae bacterium]
MQTPSEALQSLMPTSHKPAGFWSLASGQATFAPQGAGCAAGRAGLRLDHTGWAARTPRG